MAETWTTVLKPKHNLWDINLKELFSYKDLIFLFVKRNFVTKYKQTILGPLWLIISPILTTLMYVLVFGNIAGLSTDGTPQMAFYMSGNIIWTYFAYCVNQTSNTIVSNAGVFGKVYFPRLVAPISTVLTGLLDLGIQFCLFAVILLIYALTGTPIGMGPSNPHFGYPACHARHGSGHYCFLPHHQVPGFDHTGDLRCAALDVCQPHCIFRKPDTGAVPVYLSFKSGVPHCDDFPLCFLRNRLHSVCLLGHQLDYHDSGYGYRRSFVQQD